MGKAAEVNAKLGQDWLDAFNAHDVELLLSLYARDCTHTSPKIRAMFPETGGKLVGKPALHQWWADAMVRLPKLQYEKLSITASDERVFLEYMRHTPGEASYPVAEVFDARDGKIIASRVYHG